MRGFLSIRKRGFLLFSIRRRTPEEASSSVGELEMLVMKYVRRTWERGSTANGTATLFFSAAV
jgi:hypothetical protein